jgi:hypothetical protein
VSGIPDEITLHVNPLNITGGLGLGINGTVVVDAGLDDVQLKATGDPARPIAIDIGLDDIQLKIDPLNIKLEPVRLTVDPLKVDLGLDNVNVCLSLALTQLPRMQLHVPTKYNFGFSLLGVPIVDFGICGETSVVTDDNPPRIFTKAASRSHTRPTTDTPGAAYRVSVG